MSSDEGAIRDSRITNEFNPDWTVHPGDTLREYRLELAWLSVRRWGRAVRRSPRMARKHLQWAWQRLTRGWDDRALWDLGRHASWKLGNQLVEMSFTTIGYPPDYPLGFDGWKADLLGHGRRLLLYSHTDDGHSDDVLEHAHAGAQAALRWVADNLGALWD